MKEMEMNNVSVNPNQVRTDRGPFGLPRGLSGRVAGRLMASNDAQQRELAQHIDLPQRGAVCEVGYGPGVLLRLLRARFPQVTFAGADPSSVMFNQATRTNRPRRSVAPAMDLRVAAAGQLPFADDSFDVTIAVNNTQFWPDLAAGLDEMRRVTRPGGQVLVAWHGGSTPSGIQRRLLLKPDELAGIAAAMTTHVGEVELESLTFSELFTARVGLDRDVVVPVGDTAS